MRAISTKYLGPTDYKGGRIKADAGDGCTITISYPHEFDGQDAHAQAALALCRKMGWASSRQHTRLIAGGTKDGYVFVFQPSDGYYDSYDLPGAEIPA